MLCLAKRSYTWEMNDLAQSLTKYERWITRI